MSINTNDLTPSASGGASLGVEQLGLNDFSETIRPYNHVHFNSGVLHEPNYGQSGILRVTPGGKGAAGIGGQLFPEKGLSLEFSSDGGKTFNAVSLSGVKGNIRRLSVTGGMSTATLLGPDVNINLGSDVNVSEAGDTANVTLPFILDSEHNLKDTYEDGTQYAGNFIPLTSTDGNAEWHSVSAKSIFSTGGNNFPVNFSGVVDIPASDQERGDLVGSLHSFIDSEPKGATNLAEIQAKSLGLSTLGYNSGSGIINVMMASGIQKFRNSSSQAISTIPTFTTVNMSSQIMQNDKYYTWDSSQTGVRFFVPGTYMLFGVCNVSSTALAYVLSRLTINGTQINAVSTYDVVAANTFTGMSISTLLNIKAGDLVTFQLTANVSGSSVEANQSSINIIYLGPPRGGN